MMKELGLSLLSGSTTIIPQLVLLSACIYYLTKNVSADSILLFIGAIMGLIGTVFSVLVIPYLYKKNMLDSITGDMKVLAIVGIIGFIAALAFAVGFFMLVYNSTQRSKEV